MNHVKKYGPMAAIATVISGGIVWAAFNTQTGRKMMGNQTLSDKIWG
ncbi:hypothetical protein [Vibrio hepatarius]